MKKVSRKIVAVLVGFFLFLAVICSIVYYQDYTKQQELLKRQEELSKVMGVSNKNYPYFPIDYLSREAIKPGMTLDEVHKIMIGYKVVYNDDDNSEIYYYFSKDDNAAERVWVMYDRRNQYKVLKISGEDRNSNSFIVEGWSEGLLIR